MSERQVLPTVLRFCTGQSSNFDESREDEVVREMIVVVCSPKKKYCTIWDFGLSYEQNRAAWSQGGKNEGFQGNNKNKKSLGRLSRIGLLHITPTALRNDPGSTLTVMSVSRCWASHPLSWRERGKRAILRRKKSHFAGCRGRSILKGLGSHFQSIHTY